MNMYLLLRDNKQSGPMTAQELIAKGLKAYDLVWIEGKSAAWRYPSEIDELKPFSPAIEEQPYDRFFKKPEPPSKAEKEKTTTGNPAPRRAARSVTPSRKVYINFPGDTGVAEVAVIPSIASPVQVPVPSAKDLTAPRAFSEASPLPASRTQVRKTDRRLLFTAVAIALIFVSVIGMLIINSRSQRNDIRALSETIIRMEQQQREQNRDARAYLAAHPLHAPQTEPAGPVEPEPVAAQIQNKPKPAQQSVPSIETERQPVQPSPNLNAEPAKTSDPLPRDPVSKPARSIAPAADLFSQVSVKSNNYRTGLFGGVSGLQLVLMNNSPKELSAVSVEVRFLNRENKVVKKETVNFQNILPGSQAVTDVPKSSRGVSVSCVVTDIKS